MWFFKLMIGVPFLAVIYYLLVRTFMKSEIKAAMERDPAANSRVEVIFTYAGVQALAFYKFAKALKKMSIPFLPRLFFPVREVVNRDRDTSRGYNRRRSFY